MAEQPSFTRADDAYSKEEEDEFRRRLESFLYVLSAVVDDISLGRDTNGSLYSKRSSYSLPIGLVTLT